MEYIDWCSALNAQKYAEFCNSNALYEVGGAALVDIAEIRPRDVILDYACGTGAATTSILNSCGEKNRVYGVDISEEQLAEAEKLDWNGNVTFLQGVEGKLPKILPEKVDVVICNAAFWFLDIPRLLTSLDQVGTPNCRIAFNVFGDPMPRKEASNIKSLSRPDLLELTRTIAAEEFGYIAPDSRPSDEWYKRSFGDYVEWFEQSAFRITCLKARTGALSPVPADDSWWEIPVFLTAHVPGLDYELAVSALHKARAKIESMELPNEDRESPIRYSWSYLATRV